MSKLEIRLNGRTIAELDVGGIEPRIVEAADRERALALVRAAGEAGLSRGDLWKRGRAIIAAVDSLVAAGEVVAVKEPRSARPGARRTIYFAREVAP